MFQRPMLIQMLSYFRGKVSERLPSPRSAASSYMPIATLSRPRPIGYVNTGLQLFFQSRMRGNFLAISIFVGLRSINDFRGVWVTDSCCPDRSTTAKASPRDSISISARPTIGFSKETAHIFEFPTSKTPWNPFSMKSGCIGYPATIIIRGKSTPDSSSTHRITPESINTSRSSYLGQ